MRQIVKYKNRKLYDRTKKGYVTLREINSYLDLGEDVQVIEKDTKRDVTYNTLVQLLAYKMNNKQVKSTQNIIDLIETV